MTAHHFEIRYLTDYYQTRLEFYEHILLSDCDSETLTHLAREASVLKKYLSDLCAEGLYDELIKPLELSTNAPERLGIFIEHLLDVLGETSERALFYMYSEDIELDILRENEFDGDDIELSELLECLEYHSDELPDISDCFSNSELMLKWQSKTDILVKEMFHFMLWTLKQFHNQPSGRVPVFMLRDALLPYMGCLWLYRRGSFHEKPHPVLLNRKYLQFIGGDEDLHEILIETLYQALYRQPHDIAVVIDSFSEIMQNKKIPPVLRWGDNACLRQLADTRPLFIIESGMHGTIPLWILNLHENQGTFVLYATVPWLYPIYRNNIYQDNYNYLREMETIVLHDSMFQFKYAENEKIIVSKTGIPQIEKLALYELCRFKSLLTENADLF